jgi:very-short-patch-repair endonuclease
MRHEIVIDGAIARESRSRGVDAAIALLAERQRGVVARFQLLAIELSADEIRERVESERLHPLHRGVYAVGHRAVTREGELLAAVLAGGPRAVLSHESAAELWELRLAEGRLIDVTAPTGGKRPGIRFHRCALDPSEITKHKGIPVTTPERSIIDIASRLGVARLERVIRQAEYDHLTSPASLTSCLTAHEGARGSKRLREALGLSSETRGITRSKLERRFLALLRKHGLPKPQLNVPIRLPDRWIEADCVWPAQRLIVELDGHRAHGGRHAFESDRARDRALQAVGWDVVRLTWRQVQAENALAADLRALLARD